MTQGYVEINLIQIPQDCFSDIISFYSPKTTHIGYKNNNRLYMLNRNYIINTNKSLHNLFGTFMFVNNTVVLARFENVVLQWKQGNLKV